jgi:acetyl esterase/lipase
MKIFLKLFSCFSLIAFIVAFSFFSCTKNNVNDNVVGGRGGGDTDGGGNGGVVINNSDIQAIRDVQYGLNKDITGNNVPLVLDVYLYKKATANQKFPLVLFAHGGGFLSGDKSEAASLMLDFVKAGFVGISINYRLNTSVDPSTNVCLIDGKTTNISTYMAVQDIKAALRFMVANAEKYHVDVSKIFLSGNSAGAISVLNTQYATQEDFNSLLPDVMPILGGLNNADNDLTNTYTISGVAANSGCLLSTKYIKSANLIPTIFFHGDQDPVIPIDSGRTYSCINTQFVYGSRTLYKEVTDLGGTAVLHIDPAGGHLSYPEDFITGNEICFFKSVLDGTAQSGTYTGTDSSCK